MNQREDFLKRYASGELNFSQLSLAGIQLNEVNLSRVDIAGSYLADASFALSIISNSNFENANLCRSNFQEAELRFSDFQNSQLCYSNLSYANLRAAKFKNANLAFANLKESDLRGADFNDSDLTFASLSGANIKLATFKGAKYNSLTKFPDFFEPSVHQMQKISYDLNPYSGGVENWSRVIMNRATFEFVDHLDTQHMSAAEISGEYWRNNKCFENYISLKYPEVDICAPVDYKDEFDIIFAEQVFEHLKYPYRAGKNLYKMLKEKGYVVITTPFMLRIHETPIDCTRWTETGIKYFLEECGFDLGKIHTGSWGNRECVIANFDVWQPFSKEIHSLCNEPTLPIVVWAIAEK